MKKVTSFTHHTTAEGERITFTYSEIDESTGQLLASNVRNTLIVLDEEILDAVKKVNGFLLSKI